MFYLGDNRRRVTFDVFDLKNLQYRVQNISISSDFFKFEILDFTCKFDSDRFECLFYPNSRVFVMMVIKINGKNVTRVSHEVFERYLDFDPIRLEFNKEMLAIESKSSLSKKNYLLVYKRNSLNTTNKTNLRILNQANSTNSTMKYLHTSLENFEIFDLKNSKIILIKKSNSSQSESSVIESHNLQKAQVVLNLGRKDLANGYVMAESLGRKDKPFKIEGILGLKTTEKADTKSGKFLAHALNILALVIVVSLVILVCYYCMKKRTLRRLAEQSKREEEKVDLDSSVTDMII